LLANLNSDVNQARPIAAKCAHAPKLRTTKEAAPAPEWTAMVTASPAKDNGAGIKDKGSGKSLP